MPRYDNIFLTDTAETYNFSSAPKQGGELRIPPRTNRQAHSDSLISQFRDAQNQFNSYTPQPLCPKFLQAKWLFLYCCKNAVHILPD